MQWTRFVAVVAGLCFVGIVAVAAQAPSAKNPLEGNADAIRAGMGSFRGRCADCHGMDARGVRGPDITQVWASGRTDDGLFKTIKGGVPGTEMPANPRMSDHETWQILAYLRTLAAPAPTDPPRGNAENGEKIFRAMCASCHRVNGVGGRLGPDLSRVGVGAVARDDRAADPRRHRRIRAGLRAGHADAADRPADRRREEERGPVLGPDHGHARADPGLREGRDESGAERHAVGDAGVRLRPAQRQRSRRSAPLPADAARLRSRGPSSRRRHARRRLAAARLLLALLLVARRRRAAGAQQAPPPPLVTSQEILDGLPADGSRWLTFGGNYTNQRHSPLTQITPANVNRLVPQWTFQTGTLGNFETTSLLRDNVLYVTGPQNVAWALDARTGRQIWRYRRELPDGPDRVLRAGQPRVRRCSATSCSWPRSTRTCWRST